MMVADGGETNDWLSGLQILRVVKAGQLSCQLTETAAAEATGASRDRVIRSWSLALQPWSSCKRLCCFYAAHR